MSWVADKQIKSLTSQEEVVKGVRPEIKGSGIRFPQCWSWVTGGMKIGSACMASAAESSREMKGLRKSEFHYLG